MTSSNGNIFRVTGLLCGEFTAHRRIPLTKASDAELWCFLWSAPWINGWVNNRNAGDLRLQSRSLWRHSNVPWYKWAVLPEVRNWRTMRQALYWTKSFAIVYTAIVIVAIKYWNKDINSTNWFHSISVLSSIKRSISTVTPLMAIMNAHSTNSRLQNRQSEINLARREPHCT